MMQLQEAAQYLIRHFNRPANQHAVWIRTELGDDAKDTESRHTIMVAVHPSVTDFPAIPALVQGVAVRQVPWQPDDVRDHPEWHETVAKAARS